MILKEVYKRFQDQAIDFSRRNRLLRYPKRAYSIQFDGTWDDFRDKYIDGIVEDLNVDFEHTDIFRCEELKGLKKTQYEKMFSEDDFTIEMEKELEELENSIPKCTPKGEKLVKALERFRLENKRKFEEHGLHTLFIALGYVRWRQPIIGKRNSKKVTDEYDYEAPILLLPISLETKKRPSKNTRLSFDSSQYDAKFNPVLKLVLEREYSAKEITVFTETEELISKYAEMLQLVKESFESINIECDIQDSVWLRMFSFHGQQIYEDLRGNEEGIQSHEFITALCEGTALPKPTNSDLGDDLDAYDQCLQKEEDFTVLDADSSQLDVIHKSKAGNHMVVTGPPGTGKSQTIVNCITSLVAEGKSVLLVCEKQAALKVVYNRMSEVGLDRLCLPLYDHQADKKNFAEKTIQDYKDTVNMRIGGAEKQKIDFVFQKRTERIQKLSSYAKALLEKRESLDRSVYWVHGELSKHQAKTDKSLEWIPDSISEITHLEYLESYNLLKQFSQVLDIHQNRENHQWRNVERKHFSPDFVDRVKQAVDKLEYHISCLNLISESLDLDDSFVLNSIDDFERIFLKSNFFDSGISYLEIFSENITIEKFKIFLEQCEKLSKYVEQYKKLLKKSTKDFRVPTVWEIPPLYLPKLYKPDVELSKLEKWDKESPELEDHTNSILHLGGEIGKIVNVEVLHQPYEEIVMASTIFHNAKLIKQIKNWHDLKKLKLLKKECAEIFKLDEELKEKGNFLNEYGILEESIERAKLQEIEKRFRTNYKTWFRRFSKQYQEDCAVIIAFCSLKNPIKYVEFKDIVLNMAELERSRSYLAKRLMDLSKKSLEQEISGSNLGHFIEALDGLIQFMIFFKIDEVPRDYQNIINRYHNYDDFREFAFCLNELDQTGRSIIELSKKFKNIKDYSLQDFIEYIVNLKTSIAEVRVCMDMFNNALIKGKAPHTVKELDQDFQYLEELFRLQEEVSMLDFSMLDEKITSKILNNSNNILQYKGIASSIITAFPYIQKEIHIESLRNALNIFEKEAFRVKNLLKDLEKIQKTIKGLFESEETFHGLSKISLHEALCFLNKVRNDNDGLEKWVRYKRLLNQLRESKLSAIVEEIDTLQLQESELVACYAKTLWNAWLEELYGADKILCDFDPKNYKEYLKEFRALDKQTSTYNVLRVLQRYKPVMENAFSNMRDEAHRLVRESQKKRHQPIRKVLGYTANLVQKLKPCWLMSPLTLSSFLPYGRLEFDVVIFDEASQIRVEHALGAIARAKQVIVIGDPNQLPPTSFFDSSVGDDEDAEEDEYGETIDEKAGYESLIHAARTVLPHSDLMFTYHYRSQAESLIVFSNYKIYDRRLITFPAPLTNDDGVEFVYVKDGIYDSGGTRRNEIEASKVARMCIELAKEYGKNKSIGVIAFSKAQEVAVRDAIALELQKYSEFSDVLDENNGDLYGFFVKNLESVQGDERDIIILSIGYGKDKNGNVYNRFGPINSASGHRRLNVAVTRAKQKMYCVSSIRSIDVSPSKHSKGAILLQQYLEYAEKGIVSLEANTFVDGTVDGGTDSDFEKEVKLALESQGYKVKSQHGISGYKIDLVIEHPDYPSKYILAVECDGATYHSTKSARDRDRLRQEVLERLGWEIYRIWSQHWLWDRAKIIQDIVATIEELRHKEGPQVKTTFKIKSTRELDKKIDVNDKTISGATLYEWDEKII